MDLGAGSCLGALAGVLMAPVTLIFPDMGLIILIKAVAAAVVGGLIDFQVPWLVDFY